MIERVFVCPECLHVVDYYETSEWQKWTGYVDPDGTLEWEDIADSEDYTIYCPECGSELDYDADETTWIEYDMETREITEMGSYWENLAESHPEDFTNMLEENGFTYPGFEEIEVDKTPWTTKETTDIFVKPEEVWKV